MHREKERGGVQGDMGRVGGGEVERERMRERGGREGERHTLRESERGG
jgi:hypothetical protein